MYKTIALFSILIVICLIFFTGCATTLPTDSSQCIVLANGGNKLCGEDAAVWCKSTNAIREVNRGSGPLGNSVEESQKLCKRIESENK